MKNKKKIKKNINKVGLSTLATFTAKSISTAYSSYKKNQEQKKIRESLI